MELAGRRIRAQLDACWTIFRLVNLRELTGRRRRAALTAIGIAAGVSLAVAITLVNATVRGTVDQTALGLAGEARFEVRPLGPRSLSDRVVRTAQRVPGVDAVVPTTQQVTRMEHRGSVTRVLVVGVPPTVAALFPAGFGGATRAVTRPTSGAIVLSPGLAEALDARAGSRVTVSTPRGPAELRVAAVLPSGPLSSVNGGELALAGLADSQRIFDRRGGLDMLYLTGGGSPRRLQRALGRGVLVGDPGASAQPYKHTFDGIAATTQQIRTVALLVAVFLVLNTMAMSLAERRRDLALIATSGAQRAQIAVAFVAEAALLGLAGGAIGVGLGYLLAHGLIQQAEEVYQSVLPITASGSLRLTVAQALLGIGSGAAVAMAGAAIAARRVLRLTPIDALGQTPPYELGRRRAAAGSRRLALSGAATLACAGLLVGLAPVGSQPAVLGLVLALTLAGTLQLLPFLVATLVVASRRVWPRMLGLRGRLAADGLARVPGRTTIAAGALALTTGLVVATATGLGSFEREVNRAASTWYASPLYVRANGEGLLASDQPLPVALRERLVEIEGVRAAYPMRVLLLERDGQQLGILAWPIAEAARAGDEITGDVPIGDARLVAAVRRGEVVASRLTARRRDLEPGDRVSLPTSARGTRPFRVAGTFNDLASSNAFYVEHAVYRRLTRDPRADRFALVLDRGADRAAVAARVQRYLDDRGLPGTVVTSAEMEELVLDVLRGVFSLASGAQLAVLLIAAMVMLNTMLTVTFERRREQGVQRMLGMTGRQLSGAVVLEAVVMAAIGAAIAVLLGLVLGFVMTTAIETQLAWQVGFHPALGATLAAAALAVAVGAAAACYPSWLATRPPLIELLRSE